jgi:hypothetical protein
VAVDGLLDQHRGDHPAAPGQQGQPEGDAGPTAQLGRGGQPPPEQPQGLDPLAHDLAPPARHGSPAFASAAS